MRFHSADRRPGARPGAVHLAHRRGVLLHTGTDVPGRHPPGRVLEPRQRERRGNGRRDRLGGRLGLWRRLLRGGRRHGPGGGAAAAAAQEEQRPVDETPSQGNEPLDRGQGRGHRFDSAHRFGVRHLRVASGHSGVLRRRERRPSRGRRRQRHRHHHHRTGTGIGVPGGRGRRTLDRKRRRQDDTISSILNAIIKTDNHMHTDRRRRSSLSGRNRHNIIIHNLITVDTGTFFWGIFFSFRETIYYLLVFENISRRCISLLCMYILYIYIYNVLNDF